MTKNAKSIALMNQRGEPVATARNEGVFVPVTHRKASRGDVCVCCGMHIEIGSKLWTSLEFRDVLMAEQCVFDENYWVAVIQYGDGISEPFRP